MKRNTLILLSLLCSVFSFADNLRLDSLLNVLDQTIGRHKEYVEIREGRIRSLKEELKKSGLLPAEVFSINMQLYKEYRPYRCDSAISYLNRNLDLAEEMNDSDKIIEVRLPLAYYLSSVGMYKESMDVLEAIHRGTLGPKFLVDYYNTTRHVYSELSFYSQDKRNAARYSVTSATYRDSLYNAILPEEGKYLRLKENCLLSMGRIDEALELNARRMNEIQEGTADYALATYFRSLYYARKGNAEQRKIYLAISAITDIQLAITDNASLWALADSLYANGDVNRAYHYIHYSLDNANLYNARLRSTQISGIQSIINKTYQAKSDQQKEKLVFYLVLISFLSALLIVAVFFINKQVKKVSVAKNNLQEANRLLQEINLELSESNHVKEEYISHSLTLCSTYINKLESFRKLVRRKIHLGQANDLYKLTQSEDWMEKELKEFYTNFDNTFLHLYPHFVREFNTLLLEEEKIVLKKGELLNTELRIFALIRLGIDDSSKIASFLGYSVNTIYNYRAKVKNKSKVSRDGFEDLVKRIGASVGENSEKP